MRRNKLNSFNCDLLIIGSGIAGLLLAKLAADNGMSVLLASKGKLMDSNTSFAQGGLAAVTGANPVDSFDLHLQDTLSSGAGLTDEAVARTIVSGGRALIETLEQLGVSFDKVGTAHDMALEGGHSRARILHDKDASGRAISSQLVVAVHQHPQIEIWEEAFALDLLVAGARCHGALFALGKELSVVTASNTALATGGLGQVFSRTTNPSIATGDGIAMAYRAGAELVDMEFVQFHPTALFIPGAPADLVSEAVRGAGAWLLDDHGNRFAFRFHRDGELATRDIVARAIYSTMMEQQSDRVMLDMRPIGSATIASKFPNILKRCLERGLDPRESPLPVAPAAHYFMGGIRTDATGRTSLDGLYALGECASTGLHGANRLASNSLLEGGVMAIELAKTLSGINSPAILPYHRIKNVGSYSRITTPDEFRRSMFRCVGLERDRDTLRQIVNLHDSAPCNNICPDRSIGEFQNISLLGWLIACSALIRNESRGSHWRSDYPQTNDRHYARRYVVSRTTNKWIEVQRTQFVGRQVRAAV